VHHLAKLHTDDQLPSKRDVKGSGAITDQVDNVLLVHRNKKKEHKFQAGQDVSDLEPDATLMCEKQRNGEAEEWYGLWYNRECQQFVEAHDSLPMCFDAAGAF
jgi:twinkle protein